MVKHGMRITVIPYEQCPLPKAYLDATEKYAGQVRLSDGGRRVDNYIAGMPFPNVEPQDPLAAWKVMWNHEYKSAYSDDVYTEWVVENQDESGTVERLLSSDTWRRLRWTGCLYREPKPDIPHHPP